MLIFRMAAVLRHRRLQRDASYSRRCEKCNRSLEEPNMRDAEGNVRTGDHVASFGESTVS